MPTEEVQPQKDGTVDPQINSVQHQMDSTTQ